jgi:hypothetical protein
MMRRKTNGEYQSDCRVLVNTKGKRGIVVGRAYDIEVTLHPLCAAALHIRLPILHVSLPLKYYFIHLLNK